MEKTLAGHRKEQLGLFAKRTFASGRLPFVVAFLLTAGAGLLFAFQSQQRFIFQAGVVTGGFKLTNVKIRHTRLQKASPITQQVIILGEAGAEVPPVPPAYETRLTPFSDFGPIENRKIRVTVLYRYVRSLAPEDTTGPLTQLPIVEGPDFTAFAFQVTPSSVTTGSLQYRIIAERLEIVEGQQEVIARVTYPPTTTADPEPFVSVNVQANASVVIGPEGGTFLLEDGNPVVGDTSLAVPAGLLGGPTLISLDEVSSGVEPGGLGRVTSAAFPGGLSNPFAVYHLSSDIPVHGITQLTLLYPDFEFPKGQDGIIDGTTVRAQDIAVLEWDGFVWRRLGGTVNLKNNTITVRISNFNYVAIAAAPPLSPEDRRPLQKIITPNGDGVNDTADFLFGDLPDDIHVEIYDIGGHRVKTLMSSTSMQWDGRNDSGEVVESGVYIYQYTVDGKLISGLIAVAK